MRHSEIEKKVKAIIYDRLGVEEELITPQTNFITDLDADSLDVVDLVMGFEKEFNIEISDKEFEKINTVGEAISLIMKYEENKAILQ